MATKNNPGNYDYYKKAGPNEPIFVLLARDLEAPDLVRQWAKREVSYLIDQIEQGERIEKSDIEHRMEKAAEALMCALDMELYASAEPEPHADECDEGLLSPASQIAALCDLSRNLFGLLLTTKELLEEKHPMSEHVSSAWDEIEGQFYVLMALCEEDEQPETTAHTRVSENEIKGVEG